MAKTREQKAGMVSALSDKLARGKSVVFTSIAGYTMGDADALRAKGKPVGVELGVAKKTLLLRALKEAGLSVEEGALQGSVLTTIGMQDEVAPAKMMAAFLKDREPMRVLGGILEGKFVDAPAVLRLSKLPGKQELLAKIVGSIHAPVSGFVNVLAGNLRGLVNVLNGIKDAKAN